MNIKMQICGVIIIVLLIIIYGTQKTLHLYREKLFKIVLGCSLVTLSFDILSLVAIHFRGAPLPDIIVKATCKAYLITLLLLAFAALFYVFVGLLQEQIRLRLYRCSAILALIEFVTIALLPIRIHDDVDGVYTEGPAVLITYAFALLTILATVISSLTFLRKVNKRRTRAITLWMVCWLGAAAIQFFNNEILLVGFSAAVGMVILYVMLEAPESNLDKQFNCFNSYSFDVYCRDMEDYNRDFSLLEIRLIDRDFFKEKDLHPLKTPSAVIEIASGVKGVLVFKNVDFSLYAVSHDPENLREVYKKCASFFASCNALNQVSFTMVEDNSLFTDSNDLAALVSFCRRTEADRVGELVPVTYGMLEGYREEEMIAREIRNALDEDRVQVYLQPICALASGRFETAEALVRIQGRDGRMLSPGLFIPVAEKSNLIVELGDRIFEKVCQFIAAEHLADLGVRQIEVNLSVIQCEKTELAEQFIATMQKYGVSSDQVNFEITETGSIKTKIPLLENMNKLTSHGSGFSLDDFGKGESNLVYLIDMPVSILKMDYDLTKSYYANEKAQHVVQNVVNLAHSLGLKVVAEGIETQDELETFRATGVDYIQGYIFSKPIPMDEYLAFIKKHHGFTTSASTQA